MKNHQRSIILIGLLVLLDVIFWGQILIASSTQAQFVMLDVGQGDSSLVQFPSGVVVMTDAGPSRAATRALDKVPLPSSKYVDLAIITHPQLDHYGGFIDLLDRYDFGAFLMTGRTPDDDSLSWQTLVDKIKEKNIPIIFIGRGDRIIQEDAIIEILSPEVTFRESGELNDTGVVAHVRMASTSILLTADIGTNLEEYLRKRDTLQADILKVSHHGSKYSSSNEFLSAVRPKIAVIGVGENRYGHPTKETLQRLENFVGNTIFRTDKDGTITIVIESGRLKVFTEKRRES